MNMYKFASHGNISPAREILGPSYVTALFPPDF